MPVDENDTEFELQALNSSSQCRRRKVEIVRGSFHRAGLSQGNKSLEFRKQDWGLSEIKDQLILHKKQIYCEYYEIDAIMRGCNHRPKVILIAPPEFASTQSCGSFLLGGIVGLPPDS